MWDGDHHHEYSNESRRLSIELGLGAGAPSYDDHDGQFSDQSEDDTPGYNADYGAAAAAAKTSHDDDDSDEEMAPEASVQPRGKPEAMAARLAAASLLQEKYKELEDDHENAAQPVEESGGVDAKALASPETVTSPKTSAKSPAKKKKKKATPNKPKAAAAATNQAFPSMEDAVRPITSVEYQNLEQVMVQFCRVPLLAEFSRPVSLLHPEVSFSMVWYLMVFFFLKPMSIVSNRS